TLVVTDNRILNQDGLRFADEFVRHKALDAIGDLALAGAPLLGAYRSVRGGHKLNHAVLCALMADRSAWRMIEAPAARRPRGHADVAGPTAPAYGPGVSSAPASGSFQRFGRALAPWVPPHPTPSPRRRGDWRKRRACDGVDPSRLRHIPGRLSAYRLAATAVSRPGEWADTAARPRG